jgi:hypothetical protein
MSAHTGPTVNDPGKVAEKWLDEIETRMIAARVPNFNFLEHLKRVNVFIDFQGPGSGVLSQIAHKLAKRRGINTERGFDATKFLDTVYPNFKRIYSTNKGEQYSYDKRWILIGERMQMLDGVKAALDPTGLKPLILERDMQLRRELMAYCYKTLDGMRITLEKKDETKKRLQGKSPGHGDAMMYLFSPQVGSTWNRARGHR